MGKKKHSSASRHKQPPPSNTVDQPSQPPTPAVEPFDSFTENAIARSMASLLSGEHEKALDFIKESVSCRPLSGYLHHVEGMVHKCLAEKVENDSDARVKHLEDGVFSCQLAVELLPNSFYCASLLTDLLSQLAFSNQEWVRVIEACNRALKIENSPDTRIEEIFGEDASDESKIENEKKSIMKRLQEAELKSLESAEKKAVEAVELEDKEEVSEVDINHVVIEMDRRKNRFKAIARVCNALQQKMIDNRKKKSDGDDEKIGKYKHFWRGSLSNEVKGGFQKVSIKELEKHLKLLECQLAVDYLSEALVFAREKKTLQFWECYDCVMKFDDYASYKCHFWNKHWMNTALKLKTDLYIESKSVEMIVNCKWKPVDDVDATKIIIDHIKSASCGTSDGELGTKKEVDECECSSVGDIPAKISKSDKNDSSKTFVDDPKWTFCDDNERAEILVRIRDIIKFLLKNSCLASSQIRWAIEYTKDQFESLIPLSQFRNHGLETLQIICCLSASQLTEVLEFLRNVASYCGLSEDADINSSMNKLRGDLFDERIDFNKDYSCILWQELRGEPNETDNSYAVEEDGSAIILALECEEIYSPKYDTVSWLHLGSSSGEALDAWTCLRDFQRRQAMKFLKMFDEELLLVSTLRDTHITMSSKLTAVQVVGSMIVNEIMKMETCPEEQTQHFFNLLKKRQKEIKKNDDVSATTELEVLYSVLGDAVAVMSCYQSGSEECSEVNELKRENDAIKIALRRLKLQLLKDLSLLDAIVLRSIGAIKQYEVELASVSVYDYRSIIVPMLKSFLQPHLKDLYEDAEKKSKAAEEALLAEAALEAERKIIQDSDNMKRKQEKKQRKNKNKNLRKPMESEGSDDSKHFELHQEGEEQDHNPAKNDYSLDEPKQLTVSDEDQMLTEYLKKQRLFEDEASLNVSASGSRLEELLDDSVGLDLSKKKKKKFRKAKRSKATDAAEDFQPDLKDDDNAHTELGDSTSVDGSAMEGGKIEEQLEYQQQIENEAKQRCIAEKPKNMGETVGENVVECVPDISLDHKHEEYEKRFLSDIEKAICLSLDCFEKCYGSLLPKDVSNGKTSRLDVQLYVIMQCQWYLRQIRDEFMIRLDERHTHAGDPCFYCAYRDTFSARRIASRDMLEEAVQLSSRNLSPVHDFYEEWLHMENQANKVIDISPSAYQLKRQLIHVVREIVVDLEHRRRINSKGQEKDFAEQNIA